MATNQQIDQLYAATRTSYSFPAYRSWRGLCAYCLRRGFTMDESIEILRSKWVRWAGDASPRKFGYYTSTDLKLWMDKQGIMLPSMLQRLKDGY